MASGKQSLLENGENHDVSVAPGECQGQAYEHVIEQPETDVENQRDLQLFEHESPRFPDQLQMNIRRLGLPSMFVILLVGVVVLVSLLAPRIQTSKRIGEVELFLAPFLGMFGAVLESKDALKETVESLEETAEQSNEKEVEEKLEKTRKESLRKETGTHLFRKEDLDDGNLCGEGEELFGGLCYKQCKILAEEYPIRTSAFSCCMEEPCGISNSKFSSPTDFCGGFSISGDKAGHSKGQCPHVPGVCYRDEELFDGLCYMKCNLLTKNKFPFRKGADSCCESESSWACLNPKYVVYNVSYDVGGGKGDVFKNQLTLRVPHAPLTSLTEAQPSDALPKEPSAAKE